MWMLHKEGKVSPGRGIIMPQWAWLRLIVRSCSISLVVILLRYLCQVHKIKINHCMASGTVVSINQFGLGKKVMERYKAFEHDPDFYLYSLNNIQYKDSLLVNFRSFCVGYASRFWVRHAQVFPYDQGLQRWRVFKGKIIQEYR